MKTKRLSPLWVLALGLLTGSSGCAYTIRLESLPQPALVELPDSTRVSTPGDATVRWAPFNKQRIRVTATGYRPLELDLRDKHVRFGRYVKRPFGPVRSEVQLILVPAHGPAGTWSEGDVPD